MLAQIVYDEVFMKEIIKEYADCITELETLMELIGEVESNLDTTYAGKAEDGLDNLFSTLNKHFAAYGECIITTKNYIAFAIESSIFLENMLTNKIEMFIGPTLIGDY